MKSYKTKLYALCLVLSAVIGSTMSVSAKNVSSPNGRVLLNPVMKGNNLTAFSLCYKSEGGKIEQV